MMRGRAVRAPLLAWMALCDWRQRGSGLLKFSLSELSAPSHLGSSNCGTPQAGVEVRAQPSPPGVGCLLRSSATLHFWTSCSRPVASSLDRLIRRRGEPGTAKGCYRAVLFILSAGTEAMMTFSVSMRRWPRPVFGFAGITDAYQRRGSRIDLEPPFSVGC